MKRLSPWGLVTEDEIYIAGRKNIAYGIIDTANNNVLSIEPNFSINFINKSFICLFLFKNSE